MFQSFRTLTLLTCLLLPGLLHAAPKFFFELQSVTVSDKKADGKPWDGNAVMDKMKKERSMQTTQIQKF